MEYFGCKKTEKWSNSSFIKQRVILCCNKVATLGSLCCCFSLIELGPTTLQSLASPYCRNMQVLALGVKSAFRAGRREREPALCSCPFYQRKGKPSQKLPADIHSFDKITWMPSFKRGWEIKYLAIPVSGRDRQEKGTVIMHWVSQITVSTIPPLYVKGRGCIRNDV